MLSSNVISVIATVVVVSCIIAVVIGIMLIKDALWEMKMLSYMKGIDVGYEQAKSEMKKSSKA